MSKKLILSITVMALLLIFSLPVFFAATITKTNVIYLQPYIYTKKIACKGEVSANEEQTIEFNMPLVAKEIFVTSGAKVSTGQKLFDVDKDLVAQLAIENSASLSYTDSGATKASAIELEQLKNQIPASVYSPSSGIIYDFNVNIGELIAPKETVAKIKNSERYFAKIKIPEEKFCEVAVGDRISYTPVAFSSKIYSGTLKAFAEVNRSKTLLDSTNTSILLYGSIDDADLFLKEGFSLDAIITTSSGYVYTLPYTAIDQDKQGEFVFAIKEGKAKKIYITTGAEFSDCIEVVDGITLQDAIVQQRSQISKEGVLVIGSEA